MNVMKFSNEESNYIDKSNISMKSDYIQANDWMSICKLGKFLDENSRNKFLSSFCKNESEWKSLKVKVLFYLSYLNKKESRIIHIFSLLK